nr:retrovirus-related Pol polyprotein from transposon TNT 1-94 [Tanacetum cinerariifolium]
TVRFGNNVFAVISGYGDVVIGSMMIKKVYYVEGLGHNLFSVGQFCNKGLEVAFRKSTCFVRNEDGVDLLTGKIHQKHQSPKRLLLQTSLFIFFTWICVVGITKQFSAARTPQQNGVVERRNRTLVEAARTMLTFANLPSFLWAEAIAIACFTQNRSIIHKRFDKTPYELINKRKRSIKFFHVFGCRCYFLNDYEDVGKLKAKGDIGEFVSYSKESAAFIIYNKRTRKIHESVNVNFDELSEMASKQFSLEPGLSNLNKMRKSSNLLGSQVEEASKKNLEDLFQDFYDEYFDSSKIMKSLTTNVETSINEEAFNEVSESFQGESSSSSLNDDVQQSLEEVILLQTNTQSIPINMVPNSDEASTSHNVFNERLEDAYFDASFVSKKYLDHVYALDKALYGLKQAPRAFSEGVVISCFCVHSSLIACSLSHVSFDVDNPFDLIFVCMKLLVLVRNMLLDSFPDLDYLKLVHLYIMPKSFPDLFVTSHGGTMALSLMHQWHDTIYGRVIGPRRSVWMHPSVSSAAFSFPAAGTKREAGI